MTHAKQNHLCRSGTSLLIAVLVASLCPASRAHAAEGFPILFGSAAALAPFGIGVGAPSDPGEPGQPAPFPNACYDFSVKGLLGEVRLSVSDKILALYKARGFTRKTLCMALVSRAKFDPETGTRLPTYILRDDSRIAASIDRLVADVEAGSSQLPEGFSSKDAFLTAAANVKRADVRGLSEAQVKAMVGSNYLTFEEPLAVPACFKNGTPYSDCKWRFGLRSGKRLSNANVELIAAIAKAVDRQMSDAIASGKPILSEATGERAPYLEPAVFKPSEPSPVYEGQPPEIFVPQTLLDGDKSIAWFDFGVELPKGYGYAFHAWGEDDGATGVSSILDVFDRDRESSKFDREKIKKLVEED